MATAEINVWIPALSALAGAFIGSLSPVVSGWINARAESRRERLKLAVQMAIEDHKHLFTMAQQKARSTGAVVGVPPISAVLAYHVEVLEAFQKAGTLEPDDFLALRARAKASYEALAGDPSDDDDPL
jgi:hypothetical protein